MEKMELNNYYKCEFCGNIVQLVAVGGGDLFCCGEAMILIESKDKDLGLEKHLPFIEIKDGKLNIKIGQQPHPMSQSHYIQWIEVRQGDRINRQYLNPEDMPQGEFEYYGGEANVLAYCNIHGLWGKKIN